METYQIKNGSTIQIKPMDSDFILTGDIGKRNYIGELGTCTADQEIIPYQIVKPNPVTRLLHQRLMDKYGNAALLAWNRDHVVGFINFHPIEARFPFPVCLQVFDPLICHEIKKFSFPEPFSRILQIRCVSVAINYRRQGLGSALVRAFEKWAQINGWSGAQVWCQSGLIPIFHWWIPAKSFWDKLGYKVFTKSSEEEIITSREKWANDYADHPRLMKYVEFHNWKEIFTDYVLRKKWDNID